MKKLLAILLSLLMVCQIFVPVCAESEDTITVLVDGVSYEFELSKVKLGTRMEVHYDAFNPRGEKMYTLTIYMNKNYGPGTYTKGCSVSFIDYSIRNFDSATFNCKDSTTILGSVKKGTGSYSLTILSRSSDWMTYTVSLKAEAVARTGKATRELEIKSFTFTLPG